MALALAFKVIILGIVEGLTEFAPVSSTAHLLLVGSALHIPSQAFLDIFSICIQSGAILAVVWCFWRTIWGSRNMIWKVAVAFIPTALAGVFLYPHIKPLFENNLVIALALIIGGIALIRIRPDESEERISEISWKQSFWIGVMQIFSFIPGVSRAGATLIGGSLMKIPRSVIVPFSFLLAIPTILGASAVALKDAMKTGAAPGTAGASAVGMTGSEWALIALGTLVAFIVAMLTIKLFIRLLTKKPLSWFGWYRIAIGALVIITLVIK